MFKVINSHTGIIVGRSKCFKKAQAKALALTLASTENYLFIVSSR